MALSRSPDGLVCDRRLSAQILGPKMHTASGQTEFQDDDETKQCCPNTNICLLFFFSLSLDPPTFLLGDRTVTSEDSHFT